jgi:hypothetical protein
VFKIVLIAVAVLAFLPIDAPAEARAPHRQYDVPADSMIIAYVTGVDVCRIDSTVGRGTLASWLRGVVGPNSQITWEVNDCGEGPREDTETPFCVEAECRLSSGGRVIVSLIAGNSEKGIVGVPELWNAEVQGMGPPILISRLRDLAPALRRAWSRRH